MTTGRIDQVAPVHVTRHPCSPQAQAWGTGSVSLGSPHSRERLPFVFARFGMVFNSVHPTEVHGCCRCCLLFGWRLACALGTGTACSQRIVYGTICPFRVTTADVFVVDCCLGRRASELGTVLTCAQRIVFGTSSSDAIAMNDGCVFGTSAQNDLAQRAVFSEPTAPRA
jgi:hypothetical protein